MKREVVLLWLFGFGLACSGMLAASTGSMDLEQLTQHAFDHNPRLAAVKELRREVAGGVLEARAGAFPQLEAVGGWNMSRNPSLLNSKDFSDFVPEGFRPEAQEIYNLGIELTQTLYSGGKIAAAVDLAEVLALIAESSIETARLDLAADVAEAYFSLLAAEGAVETIELQEKTRMQSLRTVEDRLEIGEATRLEQLRAVASLAEVGPLLEQRRGEIELAATQLRALLGMQRNSLLEVASIDADLPGSPPIDGLLEWARTHRPELMDLDLQKRSLGLQETIQQADGRPQIELEGRYGHQARLPDDLTDALFADWSVRLGLTWSFFDGGRRRGKVAQLESQGRQLTLQIADLQRSIEVQIEEGLVSYRSARASWEASRVAAEAAREARRVAGESYNEGVALQVDLLDAQDQEAAAELAEVEAYHRALGAGARLARAVGVSTTELIKRDFKLDSERNSVGVVSDQNSEGR